MNVIYNVVLDMENKVKKKNRIRDLKMHVKLPWMDVNYVNHSCGVAFKLIVIHKLNFNGIAERTR